MNYKLDLIAIPGTVQQLTKKEIKKVIDSHPGAYGIIYSPDNSSLVLKSTNAYNTLDVMSNQGWSSKTDLSKIDGVNTIYVINAKSTGIELGFKFELQRYTYETSFKWSGDRLNILKELI